MIVTFGCPSLEQDGEARTGGERRPADQHGEGGWAGRTPGWRGGGASRDSSISFTVWELCSLTTLFPHVERAGDDSYSNQNASAGSRSSHQTRTRRQHIPAADPIRVSIGVDGGCSQRPSGASFGCPAAVTNRPSEYSKPRPARSTAVSDAGWPRTHRHAGRSFARALGDASRACPTTRGRHTRGASAASRGAPNERIIRSRLAAPNNRSVARIA